MFKYVIILGLFLVGCKERVVVTNPDHTHPEPVYINCKTRSYWSKGYKKTAPWSRRKMSYKIRVEYCDGEQGRVVHRSKRRRR